MDGQDIQDKEEQLPILYFSLSCPSCISMLNFLNELSDISSPLREPLLTGDLMRK
jgi:hypothetical protein